MTKYKFKEKLPSGHTADITVSKSWILSKYCTKGITENTCIKRFCDRFNAYELTGLSRK